MPESSPVTAEPPQTTFPSRVRNHQHTQSQSLHSKRQALSSHGTAKPVSSNNSSFQTPQPRSHGHTVNVVDDGPVDVLATATFNETPDADVGYFGPTSNHFMFRSLSEVFVKISSLFGVEGVSSHGLLSSLTSQQMSNGAPTHVDLTKPSEQELGVHANDTSYSLPRYQDAILWINHYFATTGVVLPYVEKATIVSQYLKASSESPPRFRRGFFALISIIWALSLSSLGDNNAETYYQRALAVLTPRCLRGSSIEIGRYDCRMLRNR